MVYVAKWIKHVWTKCTLKWKRIPLVVYDTPKHDCHLQNRVKPSVTSGIVSSQ